MTSAIRKIRSDAHDPAIVAERLPQYAVGSRAEWTAAGAPRRMFGDGRLLRLGHDLYAVPDAWAADPLGLLRSVLPSDAILSGWACGAVYGVRDAGPGMVPGMPDGIGIYLPRSVHKYPPAFAVLRCDLADHEWLTSGGCRIATPARAAYDMIRFCRPLRSAVAIGDCFAWQGNAHPATAGEVLELADAHPRARGNPRLRRAAELISARSRSIAESMLRIRWIEDVGLDRDDVLVNATLTDQFGREWEIDLVDIRHGIAAEYDGADHGASEQRARDARKDQAVYDANLTMVRYNSPDLRTPPAQFMRHFAGRRTSALARGCDIAVGRLVASGALSERPLKIYRPAVESVPILGV